MPRYQLIGIFVVALIFSNWPFAYSEVKSENYGNSLHPLRVGNSSIPQQLTLAGWPCKFYQSSGTYGDRPRASFSWTGLGFNLLCWSAIGLGVGLYLKLGKRKPQLEQAVALEASSVAPLGSASKSPRNALRLRDLFLLTALIAWGCGYWQVLENRRESDRQLAYEISGRGGATKSVAMLPGFTVVAKPLQSVCLRITEVFLVNPNNALVEKVVALPYLRSLIIAGGSYDLSLLKRLNTNPLLAELGIIGRPLDQQAIVAIGSMPALRALDLMRTNITAEGLQAIGQPNLRELSIIHTDVNLSELGTPPFAASLRILRAPHPPLGRGDALVLEDWPELEEFSCFEYDELLNQEPVVLKLKNLPKLTSVQLDALQLFDLELESLPNLSKIALRQEQWQERTTPKQIVPSFAWIRNLRIREVPKLTEFVIFGSHTQSIDIDQSASMMFGICVYNEAHSRNPQDALTIQFGEARANVTRPGYLSSADIAEPIRQKWIDDLAHSAGVDHLDLASVPLDGLNLAPLAKNRSIRQLSVGHSGVKAAQLLELAGLEQLEVLSLSGLRIDGRTIEALVKSFPNLRVLGCNRSEVLRLRLENVPNLESVFEEPQATSNDALMQYPLWDNAGYLALDGLRIVDAPKLQDNFVSDVPLRLLHIESAPRLSGLSFQHPLPAGAVIKGVTDLKFFAAGGANCTDGIVSEVLKSTGLKKLTLAYTELAPETLQSIGSLSDLEYLVLTGSSVDDQLVESLGGLSKLRVLRLDQTRVTNRSIPFVSKFTQLELLDVGDLQLSPQDATLLLNNLKNLRALNLAGVPLTLEHLKQISKLSSLRMLDLSRSELNDEQLIWLANNPPPALGELKLNSAKLGAVGFRELLKKSRTDLKFALADTDVDLKLLDWLVSQERVTSFSNEYEQEGLTAAQRRILRMQMSMLRGMGQEGMEQTFDVSKGEIDPFLFSPEQFTDSASRIGEGVATPPATTVPMNVFQRLGAELYRLQNWGNRPPVSY